MLSETVTVARTTVSPNWIRHEPAGCLASRPVSSRNDRPAKVLSTCFTICRLTRAPEKYAERPGALPGARRRDAVGLMAETQLVDELPIAFQVHALQVLQQAAALADHFQEAALPMVVLGVRPEVIGQAVDPLGEQRDLDRGGARVAVVQPVLPDRRRLVVHLFRLPNYRDRSTLGAQRQNVKPTRDPHTHRPRRSHDRPLPPRAPARPGRLRLAVRRAGARRDSGGGQDPEAPLRR